MKETEISIAKAKEAIAQGKASLAVINNGKTVLTEQGRGIGPIINAYEKGLLGGSAVVDKIVGKAAAQIMSLGGAKHCCALTMSRSALEYLEKNKISFEYETLTDAITNREGNGLCPMEEAVKNIESPEEGFAAIKARLEEIRAKNTEKINAK